MKWPLLVAVRIPVPAVGLAVAHLLGAAAVVPILPTLPVAGPVRELPGA